MTAASKFMEPSPTARLARDRTQLLEQGCRFPVPPPRNDHSRTASHDTYPTPDADISTRLIGTSNRDTAFLDYYHSIGSDEGSSDSGSEYSSFDDPYAQYDIGDCR